MTTTLRRRGFAAKLAGGYLLLTAVTAAIGLYGLASQSALYGRTAKWVGRDLPRVERADAARSRVLDAQAALQDLLDGRAAERAQLEARLDAAGAGVDEA